MAIRAYHADPCWLLVHPSGAEHESGDGIPHYTTEADALADAEQVAEHYRSYGPDRAGDYLPVTPRQETAPCLVAECDECGYVYDESEWMVHLANEAAQRDVLDAGWVEHEEQLLCSECACTVLGHAPKAFTNPSGADFSYCPRCGATLLPITDAVGSRGS